MGKISRFFNKGADHVAASVNNASKHVVNSAKEAGRQLVDSSRSKTKAERAVDKAAEIVFGSKKDRI